MKRHRTRLIFTTILISLFLINCSQPAPPKQGPNVYDGQDSVYGSSEGTSDDQVDSETLVSDDPVYTGELGDVDSGEFDPNAENAQNAAGFDWQPIYFDFDRAELTESAKQRLQLYATDLQQNRNVVVLLEGHCDERGTENYNLALGERRAQSVKRYLMQLGVNSGQLQTISYGELRPDVAESNESAWARNRRVEFTF